MKFFTIVTPTKVYRVPAKSIQRVTQACTEVGLTVLAYHQDRED